METNPNTQEEDTNPQEVPQSTFEGVASLLDEHLGSNRVRIDSDFELSKKCFTPVATQNDALVDGSNFAGKDHKPFENVVPPFATEKESASLPKGVDYRKKNDSSLL